MDYQIVTLEEKHIVGLAAATSNKDPDMGEKIGRLWQRLYRENMLDIISDKISETTYGVYTSYESDVSGNYQVVAGCQVRETAAAQQSGEPFTSITIPAGRYAKFSIVWDMKGNGIGEAWKKIWATDLNRAYTADFEEYPSSENIENAPVNIYIALKQ